MQVHANEYTSLAYVGRLPVTPYSENSSGSMSSGACQRDAPPRGRRPTRSGPSLPVLEDRRGRCLVFAPVRTCPSPTATRSSRNPACAGILSTFKLCDSGYRRCTRAAACATRPSWPWSSSRSQACARGASSDRGHCRGTIARRRGRIRSVRISGAQVSAMFIGFTLGPGLGVDGGQDTGVGTQSTTLDSASGNSVAWGTTYTWANSPNNVKGCE